MNSSHSESVLSPVPHRQYRFGDFLLDVTRGALFREGNEIPLRKQAYEMLVLLVEHQGELRLKSGRRWQQ